MVVENVRESEFKEKYLLQEGWVDTDSIADTRLEDHYAQHWGYSYSNCILRIFNKIIH